MAKKRRDRDERDNPGSGKFLGLTTKQLVIGAAVIVGAVIVWRKLMKPAAAPAPAAGMPMLNGHATVQAKAAQMSGAAVAAKSPPLTGDATDATSGSSMGGSAFGDL